MFCGLISKVEKLEIAIYGFTMRIGIYGVDKLCAWALEISS